MVERCVALGRICGIHDLAQLYPLKVFPDAVGVGEDGRENLLLYGDLVFNLSLIYISEPTRPY